MMPHPSDMYEQRIDRGSGRNRNRMPEIRASPHADQNSVCHSNWMRRIWTGTPKRVPARKKLAPRGKAPARSRSCPPPTRIHLRRSRLLSVRCGTGGIRRRDQGRWRHAIRVDRDAFDQRDRDWDRQVTSGAGGRSVTLVVVDLRFLGAGAGCGVRLAICERPVETVSGHRTELRRANVGVADTVVVLRAERTVRRRSFMTDGVASC